MSVVAASSETIRHDCSVETARRAKRWLAVALLWILFSPGGNSPLLASEAGSKRAIESTGPTAPETIHSNGDSDSIQALAGSTRRRRPVQRPSDLDLFASIWKPQSALVTITDPVTPNGPLLEPVSIPSTPTEPVDGRSLDIYQQIVNDMLVTYAYRIGDSAYYRIQQPAFKIDVSYLVQTADGGHTFSIRDGHLFDEAAESFASISAVTETTYELYTGLFPPASWPAQVIELTWTGEP